MGFAFNRLNRLKYYEKIFSEETELYLFTTDKYKGKEKENYQFNWDLKKTKIHVEKYDPLILGIKLRKFCKKNKIERVINLGNWTGANFFLFNLFSKTDYLLNIFSNITSSNETVFKKLTKKLLFSPLVIFSKKTIFNDYKNYKNYKNIFGNKIKYLPITIDDNFFSNKGKIKTRRKLGLPLDKKIIIFVGRIDLSKGSDILIDLIKKNKDYLFIVIGREIDKNFKKIKKLRNLRYYESKGQKELIDYYNSADLGYFPQRIEGGLGMTTAECLSCGTPSINREREGIIGSKALFKIEVNLEKTDEQIKRFFKKSEKNKKGLRKVAENYIKKNYSDTIWKEKYRREYLD
jgi:glycosyltransferase involved in cell wall biosynthesis